MGRDVLNPPSYPQPYGFNTLLLSDASAAGLNTTAADYVAHIQSTLSASEKVNLTATVRATIVTHSPLGEEERTNETYWQQFYRVQTPTIRTTKVIRNGNRKFWSAMLQCGVASDDKPENWNGSWFFTGGYSLLDLPTQNSTLVDQQHQRAFAEAALRFDAKRHLCNATWTIADTSIQLSHGVCNEKPLPQRYQWMQNAQTFLGPNYWSLLYEYFRCSDLPDVEKCDTPWRIQIHAAVIALAYQATIANSRGWVNIQPGGPLWNAWKNDPGVWRQPFWGGDVQYFERYPVEVHQQKTMLTLRDNWALFWTVAIMPTLTLLAFLAILCLHSVPIGRGFGVLALLAGVNRVSLDILAGAAFSGRTDRKVYLQIKTTPQHRQNGSDQSVCAVQYCLGERRQNEALRQDIVYG